MFKRLFWVSIGVGIGVVAVTKAQAYVKANTPDTARQFLLAPDQDHVTMRTLFSRSCNAHSTVANPSLT